MKVRKPMSKRVPVRLRHKIEKASAAKQRKQRKEAKKNPQWRSRLKKDPGIPNLFPYKNQILSEIEEGRRRKEEEALRRREVARAQRQGSAVGDVSAAETMGEAEEEEDDDDNDPLSESEQMADIDGEDEQNPLAALLASAEARAQKYSQAHITDDGDQTEEWGGIEDNDANALPKQLQVTRKELPKQALADPIKAVTVLMGRLQNTPQGVQVLFDHYQIPPLVTDASDLTTRFLVEVARKRGRLGRGGLPNLHAAALVILADLNEERLNLPMTDVARDGVEKGEVKIVSEMAEPFRIEGLFGD